MNPYARTPTERTILVILSLCLAGGGGTHVADIARGGMLPYHFVPLALNAFWTSLALLDFLAVGLLWWRRHLGIVLTLAIMLADVAINSYASYGMDIQFQSFAPLQAQTLFLGFVIGSCAIVWRRAPSSPPTTQESFS